MLFEELNEQTLGIYGLEEGAMIGFKIYGPLVGSDKLKIEIAKAHKNQKWEEYVKKCKDKKELNQLSKDLPQGIRQFQRMADNMKSVERDGENSIYYKGLKAFVKAGVKSSDFEATAKWLQTDAKKLLSDRKKEIA